MLERARIGLVGLGRQMRTQHIPYLERRIAQKSDAEIAWIGGYLPEHASDAKPYETKWPCHPGDKWRGLLDADDVDGVIISIPNFLHADAIRHALEHNVNVAVEKPTTILTRECSALVELAETRRLLFLTISQRRYEDVYQQVKRWVEEGKLGSPLLITYLITHEYFADAWPHSKKKSGGGALIASGYHGIDTMLWVLRHCPQNSGPVKAKSVSGRWIVDYRDTRPAGDRVEVVAVAQIRLNNRCLFSVVASYENPQGSLDENFKILGKNGMIRIMRDRPRKTDESAATLTYQRADGALTEISTKGMVGARWAPVRDFVDALIAKKSGGARQVLSPAKDSIETIRIIQAVYQSAEQGGKEIRL